MKTPEDVLALGRAIVEELDLPGRGAILERWLAHHLAEVLDRVDHAGDDDRPALEVQAVELILALWEKRWSLPAGFGPVAGFRRTVEALHRLAPESDPWWPPRQSDEPLHDMFDILRRCVVSGLLLEVETSSRALTSKERDALDDSEVALLETLRGWWKYDLGAGTRVDREFGITEVGGTGEASDVSEADRLHAALIEDLELMQTRLSDLLDRWRKPRPDELGT